jgi:thioredoxin 1
MAVQHFDMNSFSETIRSGTTLVDFWATWCGPCRMQAPILDAFEREMGEIVKVGKVDVDEQPDIAQHYGIRLKSLYKLNHMSPDYQIQAGDLLRVR